MNTVDCESNRIGFGAVTFAVHQTAAYSKNDAWKWLFR